MNNVFHITLPMPPNRANARWHWRTEKKKKDLYWIVCRASHQQPAKTLERCSIKVRMYLWSVQDADNLMARLKWPLDYLTRAGFIADDSPKVLDWVGMPEQFIDRKNQRIEIELSEV